jgi:hypothetical protein
VHQNGQIAQSVEHGIENPGVGGSIPSLATFFLIGLLGLGCSPDPCTELCKDSSEALGACIDEWSMDWEDFDAENQQDFQDRCSNRWGEVRSDLVARELEDAREQCDEARIALRASIRDEASCDLLRTLYLD